MQERLALDCSLWGISSPGQRLLPALYFGSNPHRTTPTSPFPLPHSQLILPYTVRHDHILLPHHARYLWPQSHPSRGPVKVNGLDRPFWRSNELMWTDWMDHLSRSVLSFRIGIAMAMSFSGRAFEQVSTVDGSRA